MRLIRAGALFGAAVFLLSACGGSSSSPSSPIPGVTPTPSSTTVGTATATPIASPTVKATATAAATATPTPAATPTLAPASVATTQAVNNGMALTNAPVTMPIAAPTGYTQSVTIPLVTTNAGTTISVTGGTNVPNGLAPLGERRIAAARRTSQSSSFSTIFYDGIVPSADITVAGDISYTQSFPAGTLAAGTSYYLAFYDTTQASPAWQTIAGPVTANGNDLTFSGTIKSTTLLANTLYGFAVFSGATPSATPPPAPQTLVYFGSEAGLTITTETGAVVNSLAIPSQTFDLDDAGDVYANDPHHGGTNGTGGAYFFARYPAGSTTADAPYEPTAFTNGIFVAASGAGEAIAVHGVANGSLVTDVWDPGVTGSPSRTITTSDPTYNLSFVITHDGSLYLPDRSSAGVPQFDVFPAGASTPSRIIPETIVPASQYDAFAANYATVGPDGTLYVTEYTFQQPDPNAGLYIYPPNGPERFIATASNAQGPGPQGVDVDASGNIYVVNNNSSFSNSTTCQGDSLQSITVYDQSGNLLRTIAGAQPGAFPITVGADGTAFTSAFPVTLQSGCAATGGNGTFSTAPVASVQTQIAQAGSSTIVLYDGTHKTDPLGLRAGRGASTGHGGGFAFRRRAIR